MPPQPKPAIIKVELFQEDDDAPIFKRLAPLIFFAGFIVTSVLFLDDYYDSVVGSKNLGNEVGHIVGLVLVVLFSLLKIKMLFTFYFLNVSQHCRVKKKLFSNFFFTHQCQPLCKVLEKVAKFS